MIGIYLIENKINHKKYVGQSIDISKRWKSHIQKSFNTSGREYDKALYRAFRKYGIDNFTFSIIELCPKKELNEKEFYWINYYDSFNNGYNCSLDYQPFHEQGEQHRNHKLKEEDVINIRTAYNNHERCKEVFKRYKNVINWTGFHKVWKGETWKHIMMDVYTEENKKFHLHNTGQKGSQNGRSLLTEENVYDIRKRKAKTNP